MPWVLRTGAAWVGEWTCTTCSRDSQRKALRSRIQTLVQALHSPMSVRCHSGFFFHAADAALTIAYWFLADTRPATCWVTPPRPLTLTQDLEGPTTYVYFSESS